uniref:uncharacterized protein LOC122591911 n=1 Tax=Erigeron canadensis TaxID=72917 RepID=UPI001CB94FDA|nr:uncharacterized protein LOC122591911 [Erigeron canadensis]
MSQPSIHHHQSNPQPYYPEPASSQSLYGYPTQPLHIRDYEFVKTAEFEPFLHTYRDKLSSDDDEETIPETQEVQTDDVQEVQEVKKFKRRAEKKPWTQEEEVALAKAWIHVSTCRVVGNEQGRDKFWERILDRFSELVGGTTRTHHSLNTKWTTMNGAMTLFNGLYQQSKRSYTNKKPVTIIPDLNEDNTPTRQRKGKKPVSEASSAATIVDSVQLYADEKKKMMAEITEKTKAILDLQYQQQKEKSERDDYKFFKKPHDDEKDPIVLEWVLNKKRHIAKTYNWPFDG